MQRARDLEVLGVLCGDAREVVGGGARVEHARVAVCVREVWVAVVLKREGYFSIV